jgi:ABC-type dipeptide/oligopeptide/nickel transport system permease subunit
MPDSEVTAAREDRSLKPGSFRYIWKKVSRNGGAMAGLCAVLIIVVASCLSPYISKYHYSVVDMGSQYARPSLDHPLGCDELGRDIMARVLYGARYTLSIGFLSVLISGGFGIILGAIAGFFGGMTDTVIMRVLDVFQAFPQLLLAIALSAVLGTGLDKCILALGISGLPNFARMMRANILTIRNLEYVEAAVSINCSQVRIIRRHVIPNAFSPLIVQISMSIAGAGLAASSLSFIGLGVQPPNPEWGAMLASARNHIRDYPHMVIIPGIFIMITVLSFNLIGDAIRDALDPKLKD